MSTVRLKCSCGHSWEYPVGEPVPADLPPSLSGLSFGR